MCSDIKQALPVARTTERVIKLRKEKIEQWEIIPSLDFTKVVFSLMKPVSTCISNEAMTDL